MKKKYYTVPETDWQEAENAVCFLAESIGGTLPELEDSGITIEW